MLDCYLFPFLFRQGASDVDGDALILFHPPPEGQAWQRRMQRWLTFRAVPAATATYARDTQRIYIYIYIYLMVQHVNYILINFAHAQNKSQAHL